jgi:hypothetical protein
VISRVLYLLIPALVYFVVELTGLLGKEPVTETRQALSWFVGNYLWLEAPYLLWLVLTAVFRARMGIVHGGFIGATLALLAMYCFIYLSHSPFSPWLFYWPLSVVCVVAGALVPYAVLKLKATQHA